MKKKKIEIMPFRLPWVIIFCDSLRDVEKEYDLREVIESRCVMFDKDGEFITAFEHSVDIDSIVHECVHLVNSIFDYYEIKPDVNNDEFQAYLTGWAAQEIWDFKHKL